MDISRIIKEEIQKLGKKLYYHGRSQSRPYSGKYIIITDSLGYASGYSDGKKLYAYSIPFGENKIFSIKNPKHLFLLARYLDKQSIDAILRDSGANNEMDWAALSYISTDEYEDAVDLLMALGFYAVRLQERQGIDSLYVFDESKLTPEGEIDISTPEMIKQIGKFYKDFSKDKNFLEEQTDESVQAYHGTPYDFDTFSTDKIGTGEGAQAFGWGLYFTDLQDVANNYANAKTKTKIYVNGQRSQDTVFNHLETQVLQYRKDIEAGNLQTLIEFFEEQKDYFKKVPVDFSLRKQLEKEGVDVSFDKQIELLKTNPNITFDDRGVLSNVTLHKGKSPEQYNWLLWHDKIDSDVNQKLIAQAEKEDVLYPRTGKSPVISKTSTGAYFVNDDITGEDLYHNLKVAFGSEKEASLFLLRAGIDGIKYPVNSMGSAYFGSRGYNYVVFDPNAVTIEKKAVNQVAEASGPDAIALEGVADKYAEREFNIPDEDAEMDKQATMAMVNMPQQQKQQSQTGKLVGVIKIGGKLESNIYANPKSLNGFDAGVRAISDRENNLFVAQTDGSFIHLGIGDAINKARKYYVGDVYNDGINMLWMRVKNSKTFAFSDSMQYSMKNEEQYYELKDRVVELQAKHPEFKFIPEIHWEVRQQEIIENFFRKFLLA